MPEPEARTSRVEAVTGLYAEFRELVEVIDERLGLTVVASAPNSGTSGLLRASLAELAHPTVMVDARSCRDGLDLSMAIADAAVSAFAPDAAAWWFAGGPTAGAAGLQLLRTLESAGIDREGLRQRSGSSVPRSTEAIELLVSLAGRDVILAVDHLGLMLSGLGAADARELLGAMRAALQSHPGLDLVLVEYRDGPIERALSDSDHPLYRAGHVVPVNRPRSARFVDDLPVTDPGREAVGGELLGPAAELSRGVPTLAWEIARLAPDWGEAPARAFVGWDDLRRIAAMETAKAWDLLRRVHPIAQPVVAAIGSGLRPHAVGANPKSVDESLKRLRELGIAWQPEARIWSLADPLLATWVREHPPPWVARRRPATSG